MSCVFWVFPEDQNFVCCGQIKNNGDTYSLLRQGDTMEHGCHSNCIYTREDQKDSEYCFKTGGSVPSVCKSFVQVNRTDGNVDTIHKCVAPGTNVTIQPTSDECYYKVVKSAESTNRDNKACDNSFVLPTLGTYDFVSEIGAEPSATILVDDNCTCTSDDEPTYMSKLNTDFEILLASSEKNTTKPTLESVFAAMFKLNFMFFSKDQESVLRNSPPCSSVRIDCFHCFDEIMLTMAACDLYKEGCQAKITNANTTCNSCFCQISKICFPSKKCPEEELKATAVVASDENDPIHPCDRPCNTSLKCVYNLILEKLNSDEKGRMADGRNRSVLTYNKTMPGPPIVICEGDELVVNFENGLRGNMVDDTTTIHFHGIREKDRPWADGVPWVTQCPILPGKSFTYGFTATEYFGAPAGTYWYHSHLGDQRTNGAYGALIIKPKLKAEHQMHAYDNDDAKNTIILQEWYESPNHHTITSLLVNGKGRIDENSQTKYAEFNVEKDKRHMFRIIGAISEDVPLRLSVEGHRFTAIAADSRDIKHVENLSDLWIAGGERYHIVIHPKTEAEYEAKSIAYKINVFGYANPNRPGATDYNRTGPYCTIAWLKYPGQSTNNYVTPSNCEGFEPEPPLRTLNPVPINNAWKSRLKEWNETTKTGNIFISDLRAAKRNPSLNFFGQTLLNTQYIELVNMTFDNHVMNYDDIPFLLQNPMKSPRCGTLCNPHVQPTLSLDIALKDRYIKTNCSDQITEGCQLREKCICPHVLQQPFAANYWTEIVLYNRNLNQTAAHPIHQHGGWFFVIGMDKYDRDIDRDFIMKEDKDCNDVPYYIAKQKNKTAQCLPRNLNFAPAKDTIQVPPGGYVILRTLLGNAGTWIMHCHINGHVLAGMAMILQVGGLGENNELTQDWCTGKIEGENKVCETTPPIGINWFPGMKPVERCVTPGTKVTFYMERGNHVIEINNEKHDVSSETFAWNAPDIDDQTFLFVCGIEDGHHCQQESMKANITVKNKC